jgi:glycosyltransferase involved in cell wall biosynthesis
VRILIANWTRQAVGGAEAHLERVAPALVKLGHTLALVDEVPRTDDREFVRPEDYATTISIAENGKREALRLAAQFRPDVVYCNNGMLDPEVESALQVLAPSAISAHGYYGTCVSGTKTHLFPRPSPCERVLGPACLAMYFPRRCGGRHPLRKLDEYRLATTRLARVRAYRAVVVHSRHMQREYARHGVRAHVVPLPIGDTFPSPVCPTVPSRIIYVGRITRAKGGRLLLDAMALASRRLARGLELEVVGDGDDRAALEAHARRSSLRVTFRGWLPHAEVQKALSAAHLIAVPSIWPEPFGMVGLEAAAHSVPAVAFAIGGIPEWLVDGKTGALAPLPPTADGFAEAMVRCLKSDISYEVLRRGARESQVRFSSSATAEELVSIFRNIATRPVNASET